MGQLRIALTISGAVSLGAYEGGALAALLLGVQEFYAGTPRNDDTIVCIDAIGGASAGSMTAVLAIRALQAGIDPVYMMYQVWVRAASLATLEKGGGRHAPLSLDAVEEHVKSLLTPADPMAWRDDAQQRYCQPNRIKLVMSLGCLQGLAYQIQSLRYSTAVEATTYLDLSTFEFTPYRPDEQNGPRDPDEYVNSMYLRPEGASPVDVALASGANEFGFSPKLLDRTSLREQYVANGLRDLASQYWYTDGGTIDNEPLGHTMDLVNELDEDLGAADGRLHILIHPQPGAADTSGTWTNPARQPDWTATLMRAYPIIRSQNLYDDLRRMEKTNTHLRWVNLLADELTRTLESVHASDRAAYTTWQAALAQVQQRIADEKARFLNHKTREARPLTGDNAGSLLRAILGEISDTAGKNETRVEVISPLLVLNTAHPALRPGSVDDLLAGEFLGAFGGFFDISLRRSDFQLGFQSVLTWMEQIAQRSAASSVAAPVAAPVAASVDVTETLLQRFVARALPVVRQEYNRLVAHMDEFDHPDATEEAVGTAGSTASMRPPAPGSSQSLWMRWGKAKLGSLPLADRVAFIGFAARVVWVVLNEHTFLKTPARPAQPIPPRKSVAVPALVTLAAISTALWWRKFAPRSHKR